MQRVYRWFVFLLAIVISVRVPTWQSHACCPVYRDHAGVQIADQKILIAWDPTTQMEHFVREAGFQRARVGTGPTRAAATDRIEQNAQGDDFGFLVPSPTQPTVEASDGLVFHRLSDAIVPKIQHKTKWELMPTIAILAPFMLANRSLLTKSPDTAAQVEVLESKQVAGYDVSVLRADDATALSDWLASHGYNPRPGLKEWAEPYVAGGWIITAFKYATPIKQPAGADRQTASSDRVDASAIRISFKTNKPIFPYRVPTDQITEPGKGHLLRTYVIGPGRARGTLSDLAPSGETINPTPYVQGRLRYSMPLRGQQHSQLLEAAVPSEDIAHHEQSWLTAFDDSTWPSSTQDLWFDFDSSGQPYQEMRVITDRQALMIPIDLIGLVAMVVILRRRKRSSQSQA